MTSEKCAILHSTLGIVGECLELIEGILTANKDLIFEECGDILFYCIDLRKRLGIRIGYSDEDCEHINMFQFEQACSKLIDAVKKFVIYNNRDNLYAVIDDIQKIEEYVYLCLKGMRKSVDECLINNIEKLEKRYPDGYTDKSAKERIDKE